MTEFVGRTGSLRVYSYQERHRRGSAADPLARNFATAKAVAITPPAHVVSWVPDVGAAGNNVPITPLSTGEIEISGVVSFENQGVALSDLVAVEVAVDGVAVPGAMVSLVNVPGSSAIAIAYLAQVTAVVGVLSNVTLTINTVDADLEIDAATMAVQEVPVSTG